MPWLGTLTIVGLIVLAVLIWLFIRTRSQDLLTEMVEKRRAASRVVSRAEYVEGLQHYPVAMALTNDTLYYENADLQAAFELKHVEEVEYDDELATGKTVEQGRVLRLRTHGTPFEFILPPSEVDKWRSVLPPRRAGGPAAQVS